jgi:hypothetical protein
LMSGICFFMLKRPQLFRSKRVVNSCLLVCGAVLRAWWMRECQDSSVGLKPASSSRHLAGQSLAAAVRYKSLQLVALRRRS